MTGELPLSPIVVQFGKYIKVMIVLENNTQVNAEQQIVHQNAFEIMMTAQRLASQVKVPPQVTERNQKDRLYNCLQAYCEKCELCWKAGEVKTLGVNFLHSLCDVLWYIDGHHHIFSCRGFPIPNCFDQFQGFNVPEASKHRKRQAPNMSCDKLEALSSKLFMLLQSSFMQRPHWAALK